MARYISEMVMFLPFLAGCKDLTSLIRLSDIREGRCAYGFFYNQVVCCSGLDRKRFAKEMEHNLRMHYSWRSL